MTHAPCPLTPCPGDSLRTSSILIIVLTTLIFTFVLSSCTIYGFLKMRNANSAGQPGVEMSEAGNLFYSTPGKHIEDEVYETVEPLETRYAAYREPAVKNSSNPFAYDYGDASSYPVNAHYPGQAFPEDSYYDDTNVRPLYADSYEVMRRPML